MQIAYVVEGLHLLKVGQGMDWTNVVQDDVQDEAHPGKSPVRHLEIQQQSPNKNIDLLHSF